MKIKAAVPLDAYKRLEKVPPCVGLCYLAAEKIMLKAVVWNCKMNIEMLEP